MFFKEKRGSRIRQLSGPRHGSREAKQEQCIRIS